MDLSRVRFEHRNGVVAFIVCEANGGMYAFQVTDLEDVTLVTPPVIDPLDTRFRRTLTLTFRVSNIIRLENNGQENSDVVRSLSNNTTG